MKLPEILTVYASILSTIVFIWNIHKAKPNFKITVVFGCKMIDSELVEGAYISVKNPSSRVVHLTNISLLYPHKMRLFEIFLHVLKYKRMNLNMGWVYSNLSNYEIDDGCPLALEPGRAHGILIPKKTLEEIFEDSNKKEIKASAQDQLWRNRVSKKI